tara:strand:- start:5964 stop:6659 length:696 start_codon:yes stop_codon:yes gene_type:complete
MMGDSLFDQAWSLVKMPIYETGIPGIKFVTQGKGDPNWREMDNVFGYVPAEPTPEYNNFTEMDVPRTKNMPWGNAIRTMLPAEFNLRVTGPDHRHGSIRGPRRFGREQRKQGPLMENPDKAYERGEMNVYDLYRNEKKYFEQLKYLHGDYDSDGNFLEYRKGLDKTPREAGDYFYRDLMDRAQAGEDILFGMPYIWPDMDNPGHNGVHRMSELFARGHGWKPVPVKIFRGK